MKKEKKFALTLAYDGKAYAGWQWQENAPSIQQTLTLALEKICKEKIVLHGSSRTDAGVHARGHVSHFQTSCQIPADKLPLALNALLPEDIACLHAKEVEDDFHARFDAKAKQYSYYMYLGRQKSPFFSPYAAVLPFAYKEQLQWEKMKEACEVLKGTHDFLCFQASGAQTKTSIRTLYALEIEEVASPFDEASTSLQKDFLRIRVCGDGFLYNMVRILAGTLLYVGLGKMSVEDVKALLEHKNRKKAGKTMPPQGLFLDKVFYEEPTSVFFEKA